MTYVQGFLLPVPREKKDAYFQMASDAAPMFTGYGATGIVEAWGDDVPDGKRTDMKRAVAAADGENVVFSWIEYPDKATCDEAARKMMSDGDMPGPAEMPFDPQRMIYSGFEKVMDEGGGPFGYVDGMIAAVPTANRDKYLEHARAAAEAFRRHGATRLVETWGVDVMDGKVTDFKRAVKAKDDETVVFSWIEWPDKASRDKGMAAIMEDPAMRDMELPFDGTRMIYGGFDPLFKTGG